MKNIFKKEKQNVKNTNIQKLDKNQLEKVVGGIETTTETTTTDSAESRAMHEMAKATIGNIRA
jgi:hypothetical protein